MVTRTPPTAVKPLLEVKLSYSATTKPDRYAASEPIAAATVSLKGDPATVSALYHEFSKLVEAQIK